MINSKEKKIDVKVDSPWLAYKRIIKQEGKDIVVEHDLKIKKQVITFKELKSLDFKKFQKKLRDKAQSLILVFNP